MPNPTLDRKVATMKEVLTHDDLYDILGIRKSSTLDRISLRRAYLSRSKACHPDKFPGNPEATHAFQKLSVAYEILSDPSSKRMYDSRQSTSSYNFFSAQSARNAEDTFKGVVVGVLNDFLDGDLEITRSFLRALNDVNPSLSIGEDTLNSMLATLQSLRERALTCRTCLFVLHAEVTRLLELQHNFHRLSYLDLMGRSRLTIQLTRVTISLPITLEKAIQDQSIIYNTNARSSILPRHVSCVLRGIDVILERMEWMLK